MFHVAVRRGRRTLLRTCSLALVTSLGLLLTVAIPAIAYPRPGLTERVSVASDGTEGNAVSSWFSPPALSADGRYVAFDSFASNLVPSSGDTRFSIFVHDRETGTTERVPDTPGSTDGFTVAPAISADGRYVAFQSYASSLVPDDTNADADTFVYDRETGSTERVSVASDGAQGDRGSIPTTPPAITPNGRFVAFASLASNLAPDDTNDVTDVFVHDRETGQTERVSVASDGTEGEKSSSTFTAPGISADGRYVAFDSNASTLAPDDTNEDTDVFVHDRETGQTERVSMASDGSESDWDSHGSAISADGRYVAFYSLAGNLVPGGTGQRGDVFVHDRETGRTERVSVVSDGTEANKSSYGAASPAISADGRYVAFGSRASNLVPGDTNDTPDVFVHDRHTTTTYRVSVASDLAQGNDASSIFGHVALSANGRYVGFTSLASNLVPGDTNDAHDVFVHDRGLPLGVTGDLSVNEDSGIIEVAGRVTLSGTTLSQATDPVGDGSSGADPAGADLTGAEVIVRPEEQDVLVRLSLDSLPSHRTMTPPVFGMSVGVITGRPGTVYGLSFQGPDARYEIRIQGLAATGDAPSSPYAALYRCEQTCTQQARLEGAVGTTGDVVLASMPAADVPWDIEEYRLTNVQAFTGAGEAAGRVTTFDEMEMPDATIPATRVDLGIAPADTPEEQVTYTVQATLEEGRFTGTIPTDDLPAGDYRVWARTCLGDTCHAKPTAVTL